MIISNAVKIFGPVHKCASIKNAGASFPTESKRYFASSGTATLTFPPDISNLKNLKIGDKIQAPFEHSLTASFETLHNLSNLECCRLYTSNAFAKRFGFKSIFVPFHTLLLVSGGDLVMQCSEQAVAHLGLFNAVQLRPVYYGDHVRSYGQLLECKSVGKGKYDSATFGYALETIKEKNSDVVFRAVKQTLFPAGTFDKSCHVEDQTNIANEFRQPSSTVESQILVIEPMRLKDVAHVSLEHGMSFVHRFVNTFHSFDFDHVTNFYRITNDLHRNRVRFPIEQIFAVGPLIVQKSLYNTRLDFGEIFAPAIKKSTNIHPANLSDMISSISYIEKVEQVNPNWERVELMTFGLKNVDPASIVNLSVPMQLFDIHSTAKQFRKILNTHWTSFLKQVVCCTSWKFIRPTKYKKKNCDGTE